jgi:NAD(P)-dependent dehydrogenase (short-subunit alcohol dehydrogenase family)
VLVNNAALDLAKPLVDTTPDEVRRIFEVNSLGRLAGPVDGGYTAA